MHSGRRRRVTGKRPGTGDSACSPPTGWGGPIHSTGHTFASEGWTSVVGNLPGRKVRSPCSFGFSIFRRGSLEAISVALDHTSLMGRTPEY